MRTISNVSATLGDVDYLTRMTAGAHALVADEPTRAGGQDAGPAPYDYVLSGLAACTLMTLRMYAQKKGWELGELGVSITLQKSATETRIHRVITASAPLDDAQWGRLLEIAGKTPVTLTLAGGAPITSERG